MISEIPDSFGKLKHLRYLNLSYTSIKWLPDSIGNLFYLQTLKLSCCEELIRLPISIGNLINLRHLDVAGAIKLQEMPIRIGKLKDLRILSNFIVDKNNGPTIKELKDMSHLRGELCISKLENVVNIQDARDADLKLKRNLESLIMQWSSELDGSGNERNQMDVLDSLQPCWNLNKLCIQLYGGPEFPRWIGDALFSKMVDLRLIDCRKCTSLPCLGQLPSLKQLKIEGMVGVKKVGAEFYGETRVSAGKFFPSLESLHFNSMSEWEHWEDWSSSTESLFPCLQELIIVDCPKLIMKLPTYLPSLTKLSVHFCPKLESPLSRLPLLKELRVGKCNEAVLSSGNDLTSLTKLTISRISGLIKLHEGFVQFLQGLRVLEVSGCEELEYLWEDGFGSENSLSLEIRDCDQLVSLGCNLQSLEISGCDKLERLPNGWQSLTCLEELEIRGCPKLASFPDVGFPPMLRNLSLYNCKGLKSLPDGMMLKMRNDSTDSNNLCLLEELVIYSCPSLICFPKGQLPTSLKSLHIEFCENLKSLPEEMMGMCALEDFLIVGCHSLIGLPKGGLPATLKRLTITDCERLESLPEGIMHQHSTNAAALQALEISSLKSLPEGMMHCNSIATTSTMDMCALEYLSLDTCPSMIGFPRGWLPITLKELHIRNCEKQESLPEGIMHYDSTYAAALQDLEIRKCPSLTSFPRGKFPSTLERLDIEDCEHLESISEEMFHSTNNSLQSLILRRYPNLKTLPDCLNTLTNLLIEDFENLELVLPQIKNLTRLISLFIQNCENIKTPLSQWGLSRLTSLKFLWIDDMFPDATSFSDDPHSILFPTTLTSLTLSEFQNLESLASLSLQTLTSLENLVIYSCPKLRSILPREGLLPDTLSRLYVRGCPRLTQRYSKEEGDDWPKIAHIPHVVIREF
ncbi:putative disease resistance protein At3g14460 isoform X1 [Vitis riparia]|uniref:putative disease resistance protein At3g14460 isoform X1 n=1 Tax=Vitis riparia TaxID=96939 RepID=UPI00155A9EE3|nr:putative disease resistance protein At3g14460 isoform X1 [Vitis riparia]